MLNYFSQIVQNAKNSFILASKGKEVMNTLIWRWGAISYLISYFVINKSILAVDSKIFDYSLSIIISIFYVWHLYAIKKCSPKKPKLTKEEKDQLKIQNRGMLAKKFMRKLLLQEPWMKSNPVFVVVVIDLFCLAQFLSYIM